MQVNLCVGMQTHACTWSFSLTLSFSASGEFDVIVSMNFDQVK